MTSSKQDTDANRSNRFEHLAAAHRDAVYRQLVRMCGNRDDAEDVLIESLVKAYRALPELSSDSQFRAWLAQIARRTCGRLKKKESFVQMLGSDVLESEWLEAADASNPEHEALETELKGCLAKALHALPEIYREAYELRDVEGLTAEETSKKLGISIPALKSRLHRARALLRNVIDSELHCV